MASRQTIIFNYKNALSQADKLDGVAKKLKGISSNDLNNTLSSLDKSWNGDNAWAFIGKGKNIQQKVNASASSINAVADEIRRTAKRIYDAEMRAIEIAESRTC